MVLNFKKIFGGIILAIGIGIIGWAIIASYGYFQGERPFPEIFKAPEIKSLSSRPLSESFQIPSQITSQQDIQALLQQEMQQQMQQQIQESIIS